MSKVCNRLLAEAEQVAYLWKNSLTNCFLSILSLFLRMLALTGTNRKKLVSIESIQFNILVFSTARKTQWTALQAWRPGTLLTYWSERLWSGGRGGCCWRWHRPAHWCRSRWAAGRCRKDTIWTCCPETPTCFQTSKKSILQQQQ